MKIIYRESENETWGDLRLQPKKSFFTGQTTGILLSQGNDNIVIDKKQALELRDEINSLFGDN